MIKIKRTLIAGMILLMLTGITQTGVNGQEPPSPPGGHGWGGDQGSVGAPIDGGAGILLSLGAMYGIRLIYKSRRKNEKEGEIQDPEV
jgi:hypothetical protein